MTLTCAYIFELACLPSTLLLRAVSSELNGVPSSYRVPTKKVRVTLQLYSSGIFPCFRRCVIIIRLMYIHELFSLRVQCDFYYESVCEREETFYRWAAFPASGVVSVTVGALYMRHFIAKSYQDCGMFEKIGLYGTCQQALLLPCVLCTCYNRVCVVLLVYAVYFVVVYRGKLCYFGVFSDEPIWRWGHPLLLKDKKVAIFCSCNRSVFYKVHCIEFLILFKTLGVWFFFFPVS